MTPTIATITSRTTKRLLRMVAAACSAVGSAGGAGSAAVVALTAADAHRAARASRHPFWVNASAGVRTDFGAQASHMSAGSPKNEAVIALAEVRVRAGEPRRPRRRPRTRRRRGYQAGRHHVGRPLPRWRGAAEQREQRKASRSSAWRRRSRSPMALRPCGAEHPVPEPERRAVAPAQGQADVVVLACGHVRQVHDRGDDLARDERVVVVERPLVAGSQPPLDRVRERARRRRFRRPPASSSLRIGPAAHSRFRPPSHEVAHQHADDRDQVQLPYQHLEHRERVTDWGRRRVVTETGRGQHRERVVDADPVVDVRRLREVLTISTRRRTRSTMRTAGRRPDRSPALPRPPGS